MTTGASRGGGASPGEDFSERGGDMFVRRAGRSYILALYGALRSIKLYPLENAAVASALAELASATDQILRSESDLELRFAGEFIFINATRLRLDLDNYASFSHLLSVFRANGIGVLRVLEPATPREWLAFLVTLLSPSREPPAQRYFQVTGKLEQSGVRRFELIPPSEVDEEDQSREKTKEVAKRTYAHSVAASKDVINSVRMGRSPNIKKVKRAVQSIVDQILNEEESLVGLTTIRDYDEYTFTHSVNVCIFSVALGRRMGLSKLQLYDLGLSALFHDLGKSRIPLDVLNKTGGLNEDEWRIMMAHPWMGVLALFQMRGQQELPYRQMVVAYEHHMKLDLTGYPRSLRPRKLTLFSKIVAAADGFDAATSRRVYQTEPLSPAAVLEEMRDNPRRGMDQVVVKAFINLVGIYPVGTLVVLDTFEMGLVHAASADPELISRPVVRVISDEKGNILHPGYLIDLAERNEAGTFARTIIKTADPERYGIRVGDFFV